MEEKGVLYKKINTGLLELPDDPRDFRREDVFGAVNMADIEPNFYVGTPLYIADQGTSDLCTAYATVAASELQERVKLSPEYSFAKIKQLRGEYEAWGADLRSAVKAATKYGFLAKHWIPKTLDITNRNQVANWQNWPEISDVYADEHKKQSYFRIQPTETLDMFDAILAALWQNRDENKGVVTGALWRDEWTTAKGGIIPTEYSQTGFGHAFIFIGSKTIEGTRYLIAQLSNGTEIGDAGLFYFPRSIVNKECVYGCYTFEDMPKPLASYLNKTKQQVSLWSKMKYHFYRFMPDFGKKIIPES